MLLEEDGIKCVKDVTKDESEPSGIGKFILKKIAWVILTLMIIMFGCYVAFFVFAANQYEDSTLFDEQYYGTVKY